MGGVRFSIDPALVRELQRVLPLKVFVETGTYEGASVQAVLPLFETLHSVELSPQLYARSAELLGDEPSVHLHHGDSGEVLKGLVPKLRRRSVLYWLDAHWCDEKTEEAGDQCPLLSELEAIGSVNDRSIVLIDDARLFMAPPPAPARADAWPSFSEVLKALSDLNPAHETLVIDDVIVFFPERARETLREYSRDHAVDLLAQIESARRITDHLDRLRAQINKFRAQQAERDQARTDNLAKRITGLSSGLESVEREISEVGDSVTRELEQAIRSQASAAEVAAAREDVGNLNRRIGPLVERVDALSEQLRPVARTVQGLSVSSRQSEEALEQLPEARREIAAISERLEALGELPEARREIGAISERLGALDQIRAINERLGALGELPEARREIAEVSERLGALDQIGAINERLEALGELPEARREIGAISERVEPLGTRMGDLEGLIRTLESSVSQVTTELGEVTNEVQQSRSSIDQLPLARQEIASLTEQVSQVREAVSLIQPRVNRGLEVQSGRAASTLQQVGMLRRQLRSMELRFQERDQRRSRLQTIGGVLLLRSTRSRRLRRVPQAVVRRLRRGGARLARGVAPIRRSLARSASRLYTPALGIANQHAPRELHVPKRYGRATAGERSPSITVLTPSRDNSRFLTRTIESVLAQDYDPLEYIVQSTEGDARANGILKRFRTRITPCEAGQNGSEGSAINLGFDRANGEVMSLVNPDALLLPGTLPYVSRYLERHPAVDVIYGHQVLVDAKGNEVGRWLLPKHDDRIVEAGIYVPRDAIFWRRQAWEAIGGELDPEVQEAPAQELLQRFRDVGAQAARVPRFLGASWANGVRSDRIANGSAPNRILQGGSSARASGRGPVGDTDLERTVSRYIRRHVILQKLYRLGILRA